MLRTFLWFFTIAIAFILTLPVWVICKLFSKTRKTLPQFILNLFYPLIFWVGGLKVDVTGLENIPDEPAFFAGNHQGLIDMLVTLTKMGKLKPFLAKKEAEKIPFIGSWMRMLECVFIDRGNARASVESLSKVEEHLKSGKSIIVFPEGTRSRKHEMGELKAGAFRPAIRAAVPIVPFVIDGSYHAWEEFHKIKPCTVKLSILKPIQPSTLEDKNTKSVAALVEEKIKEVLG